jgi:hypothetical protein
VGGTVLARQSEPEEPWKTGIRDIVEAHACPRRLASGG